MQVVPVLFERYPANIYYPVKWNLSDPVDIEYRFDTYISRSRLLGSWGTNNTHKESFLTIF